ncbi:MAG: pyridoxal-phosphate dependent enzyme [Candidatus Thorarchaeota archaeon]
MVSIQDIRKAHRRIAHAIVKTPVMTSTTIDKMTGCSVYFKCENFQRVGAFKFRGATNAVTLLTEEERERGVITHSSGNHAQALSLAAFMEGIPCTIVMPRNSPAVKIEATRGYGADIVLCEPTLESRKSTADKLIKKHRCTLVHPYDNPVVIAGAGTAALELIDEVGPLDYLFCPVGGGGLLSGTSIASRAMSPKAQVIAVEPKNADDAYRSFKSGKLVPSIDPKTFADGLRTSLSELTFSIIQKHVDDIITVTEKEILKAMRLLWERMKIVVEPSGAVSLAGLLKVRGIIAKGSKIGVMVSGGNVDLEEFFSRYEKIIE